ncbi:MAG: glucose-6-phosphate isomerase [Gammaproteobacteria bacterium]|nr:MAG: glucose-6-phosphate isomerase [Gammaproteobacteria bacterium]
MLLNKLPGWESLLAKSEDYTSLHLDMLLHDPDRQKKLMFTNLEHFVMDFSKQRLSAEILDDLIELAKQAKVEKRIASLLSGEIVNQSENRAALHVALRAPSAEACFLEDKQYNKKIQKAFGKMEMLIKRIHALQWRGFTGKPIRNVVNIGVGGSDLGPLMTTYALDDFTAPDAKKINIHFASSIDGAQLAGLLPKLNPETTLFCVVSKTFTTIDTLSNANTAVTWLKTAGADEKVLKKQHFIGISAAKQKMTDWGIGESNQLQLWDWVGGRYSLWSTVGFSIALKIGMSGFRDFLAGAHAIDQHLSSTPIEKNIPVLLSLIDVWNCNFLTINAHAILPYDGRLKHFHAYLEQLEMESNGKSVSVENEDIDYRTCPILWGEVGPNAQHAFYQLLHQGTERVNSDFLVAIRRKAGNSDEERESFAEHHSLNLSNCLAQSRVLALGSTALSLDEQMKLSPHQQYAGSQPSTTILIDELTPFTLGGLIALYEHKVFISSVLWDINPFDQWGVELGKSIAKKIQPALEGKDLDYLDCSTSALIKQVHKVLNVDSEEKSR